MANNVEKRQFRYPTININTNNGRRSFSAYSKNEKTQKILNALNIKQRTLKKFFFSESKLIGGRIYFRDKMFVPDVGQLKLRFI